MRASSKVYGFNRQPYALSFAAAELYLVRRILQ